MEPIFGDGGIGAGGAAGNGGAALDVIKDATTESFVADVIEASAEVPVIVDFWAPWCEPCKQLGPALEKAVRAAGGAVRLVKVNIDEEPAVAQQLQVRSIPAVFAFSGGQPVDGFVGIQPESQIKSFVERLVGPTGPDPAEEILQAAQAALDGGDAAAAAEGFARVLQLSPASPAALAGLVRCHLGLGDLARARQALDAVPQELAAEPALDGARAALELAEQGQNAAPSEELAAAVASDPGNHQARFDLAQALASAGDHEAALEHLLELLRRNRAWNEEAARKQILKLFEALGPTHPLTMSGRRKLSSLLFS